MSARRLLRVAGAIVLASCWTVATLPTSAGAALVYTASGSAHGLRVTETVAGSPVAETLFDGGGPTAQVLFASGGGSTSFASFPYPGDVAVAFPGQLAGLAPQVPRVPDYPFYVRATPSDPNPSPATAPGGTVDASVGPSEATARAFTGVGGEDKGAIVGRLEAIARSASSEESVMVSARSAARNIVVGGVDVASVVSTATVTLQADGTLARASSLRVTGLSAAGQELSVSNGGIVLAGTNTPLPDRGPIADALANAGIKLSYIAGEETPTGVVSAGFAIQQVQQSANGPVRVRLAFGEAAASIDGQALPDAGGIALPDDATTNSQPATVSEPSADSAALTSGQSEAFAPDESVDLGSDADSAASIGSPANSSFPDEPSPEAVPSSVPSGSAAPPEGAAPAQTAAAPTPIATTTFDTNSSYATVVAAAVALVVFAVLVSAKGVRFPWTS